VVDDQSRVFKLHVLSDNGESTSNIGSLTWKALRHFIFLIQVLRWHLEGIV